MKYQSLTLIHIFYTTCKNVFDQNRSQDIIYVNKEREGGRLTNVGIMKRKETHTHQNMLNEKEKEKKNPLYHYSVTRILFAY